MYEHRLFAGVAPCLLKDSDNLRFKIRRLGGDNKLQDLATPNWEMATFATGMEQQIPLSLAEDTAR